MNYSRHYNLLIDRARGRTLTGYGEWHHVIPRCLGGKDDADNLVHLTAEEHFVAHQLLVKMYPNHPGLTWAAVNMSGGTTRTIRINNKLYGWLRRRHAEAMRILNIGRKHSVETRAKISIANALRPKKLRSEETKAKMSAASKGKPKSEAHKKALSDAKIGVIRGTYHFTEESYNAKCDAQKKAAVTADRSYMLTTAYRERQSQNMKRIWALRKQQKQESQG